MCIYIYTIQWWFDKLCLPTLCIRNHCHVVPILFKVGSLTPLTIDLSINPGIHLFEPTELSRGKQLAGIHIAFTKKKHRIHWLIHQLSDHRSAINPLESTIFPISIVYIGWFHEIPWNPMKSHVSHGFNALKHQPTRCLNGAHLAAKAPVQPLPPARHAASPAPRSLGGRWPRRSGALGRRDFSANPRSEIDQNSWEDHS